MHKPSSVLFDDSQTDAPIVIGLNQSLRVWSKPTVSFFFNKGKITLSQGLIMLAGFKDNPHVLFFGHKGHWYLTASKTQLIGDYEAFNVRSWGTNRNGARGVTSGVFNVGLVQPALRIMNYGPGDVVTMPVNEHPVSASEIGLDGSLFPNPFFRIVKDQAINKSDPTAKGRATKKSR